MSRQHKTIFIFLSIILIFLIAENFIRNVNQTSQIKQEVSHFDPPTFFKEPTNARDFRLYRFWLQSKYDPILALPGVDIDNLREAVQTYKSTQQPYLHHYSEETQKEIQKALHPFSFLESLPTLESARRDFLEKPTLQKALLYNDNLKLSLEYYQSNSKSLRAFFVNDPNNERIVTFLAGTTSQNFFREALARGEEEVSQQTLVRANRLECLLGKTTSFDCTPRIPEISPFAPSDFKEIEVATPLQKSQNTEALREYIKREEVFSLSDTQAEDLPLVHLPVSNCTHYGSATYTFVWRKSESSDLLAFWLTPVDDLVFSNTSKKGGAIFDSLAEVGIAYDFQPINPYFCIDSSIDSGLVRTAYFIYDQLTENPILGDVTFNSNTEPQLENLKLLENMILDSKTTLDVGDVENFVLEANSLIRQNNHTSLLQNLTEEQLELLSDIVLLWRTQSAWFESEIGRLDDMNSSINDVLGVIYVTPNALFLTRSYASSLYQTSNTTLHPNTLSFLKTRKRPSLDEASMVGYNNFMRRFIPPHLLSSFLLKQDKRSELVY